MGLELITEASTRKLFALLPKTVYRHFSFEVKVQSDGGIDASVRIYVSGNDGHESFSSKTMEGLIRKVGNFYCIESK